jgi:hypothetical protein
MTSDSATAPDATEGHVTTAPSPADLPHRAAAGGRAAAQRGWRRGGRHPHTHTHTQTLALLNNLNIGRHSALWKWHTAQPRQASRWRPAQPAWLAWLTAWRGHGARVGAPAARRDGLAGGSCFSHGWARLRRRVLWPGGTQRSGGADGGPPPTGRRFAAYCGPSSTGRAPPGELRGHGADRCASAGRNAWPARGVAARARARAPRSEAWLARAAAAGVLR